MKHTGCCKVQVCGGNTGRNQVCAAAHGGQTGTAEGSTYAVTHQGNNNGQNRVKAKTHQERTSNGCRCTCTRCTLHKDRNKETDQDQLDTSVRRNRCDRIFNNIHGTGILHHIQDQE